MILAVGVLTGPTAVLIIAQVRGVPATPRLARDSSQLVIRRGAPVVVGFPVRVSALPAAMPPIACPRRGANALVALAITVRLWFRLVIRVFR